MKPSAAADEIEAGFVARGRPDVAAVELDGETVLYDPRGSASHVLNPTAGLIWQLLDGSGSVAELADEIAEAYGADSAEVCEDVLLVVRQFARQGLLEGVAGERELGDEMPGGQADGGAAALTTMAPLTIHLGPKVGEAEA